MNRRRKAKEVVCRVVAEMLEHRVLLAGTGLAGAYFNNINLTGTAAATRIDKTVDFAWSGAPGVGGLGADNFSVRWSGQVLPKYTGTYTFITRSDDGVRLFVNGTKVIDNWTKHAPTDNIGTAILTAGSKANIVMEFFEATGGATAKLQWKSKSQVQEVIPESALSNDVVVNPPPPPPPSGGGSGNGLLGTYFDNQDFTAQKFTRTDETVNFNWGANSPAGSIQADTFSVRWTGQVQPEFTGNYTFYTKSDDGAKLTVNGQVLINKLIPQGATEYFGVIGLTAGQKNNIQLEYFDRICGASASLSWSSASTAKQIIPKGRLFSTTVVQPPPNPTAPATPGGVSATAPNTNQITISWSDVANETGY
jgi:hypothetical protein